MSAMNESASQSQSQSASVIQITTKRIVDQSLAMSKVQKSNDIAIPYWMALISGGVAGTCVDVCLYPIDTLKTRLQAPNGFFRAGGFRGIYKGLSAAAIGSAPGASVFFLSYESFKPFIHRNILHSEADLNCNPLTHMLSASLAETAACLIRVPTEVVKQRMQIGRYSSFRTAISHIWRSYALRGFYVGYGTTVAREIPFSFIQFPIWERLKIMYAERLNDGTPVLPYQGAFCGSVSGAIAAAITTPLDVVKTSLMLQKDANGVPYKGFTDCCSRLYADNGKKAFFRGIVPRVSWIFVGGFFFFGAYEKTKAVLQRRQSQQQCDDDLMLS